MGPVEPLCWKSRAAGTALVCAPAPFVDEETEAQEGSGLVHPSWAPAAPLGPADAPWVLVGRVREDPGLALPGPLAQPCAFQVVGTASTVLEPPRRPRWGDHARGCWLQGGSSGRLPWALSHLKGSVSEGYSEAPRASVPAAGAPCACHGCGWGRSPATTPPRPAGAHVSSSASRPLCLHAWFPTSVTIDAGC